MKTQLEVKGKHIGVVGFNARPIACSLKRIGAMAYVSDYWGDDDLADCSEEWVAVLTPEPNTRQRGSFEVPVYESLSKNMLEVFAHRDLDSVLIGSGFDDHADFLAPIANKWRLAGNSVELIKKCRKSQNISEICSLYDIRTLNSYDVDTLDEGMESGSSLGYPLVARRTISGGGSGIHLIRDKAELEQLLTLKFEKDQVVRLQEYVRGRDVSCSVLSTGNAAETLSIQGQLVGLPSAGRLSDFVYCGNYIPLSVTKSIQNQISRFSEAACAELGLLGSNGLDFVIAKDDAIYFMEINPRMQGTLEMLEKAGNLSVLEYHYDAINGILPEKHHVFKPTVKMIVYALKTGLVPDLSQFPNTVDRTPKGVQVFRGDPICTILESNSSLKECYRRITQTATQIQLLIR